MFADNFLVVPGMNNLEAVIWWFSTRERVGFHIFAKIVQNSINPLFHLFLGILVKRMFGLNKECLSADASQLSLLRRYINSIILSQEAQKTAFKILGSHYEVVSVRTSHVVFTQVSYVSCR